MIKVIMGLKGSGKTQQLVDMVNASIEKEKGSVICIERGKRLTYNINYKARLIDISNYSVDSYAMLKGFISGLYAGNYDIEHIYLDSLYKLSSDDCLVAAEDFLDWLEKFRDANGVKFTVTISAAVEDASEGIKKYF